MAHQTLERPWAGIRSTTCKSGLGKALTIFRNRAHGFYKANREQASLNRRYKQAWNDSCCDFKPEEYSSDSRKSVSGLRTGKREEEQILAFTG